MTRTGKLFAPYLRFGRIVFKSMLSWLGDDALILEDLAFQISIPESANVSLPEGFSENTFLVLKKRSTSSFANRPRRGSP
jgi:hypothetical protein